MMSQGERHLDPYMFLEWWSFAPFFFLDWIWIWSPNLGKNKKYNIGVMYTDVNVNPFAM